MAWYRAHQDSQPATAARLRFQVAGARCPPEPFEEFSRVVAVETGRGPVGAEFGEQPVEDAGVAAERRLETVT
ncbi:hypothetical protein ACFP2T_43015 [Plantactinospora solaniradicis]|uniref:Uncharacterized protein n=1 Tax=Plantactinospora solaniradicis TaxID=1723736 RepID=A0ABW1KN80_9ACTN